MEIKLDDVRSPEVVAFVRQHLQNMASQSPAESCHALDVESLRKVDITFWSAWEGTELAGCGALKELSAEHGEIKSMRTATAHLRKGVARQVLQHIVDEARRRGYKRISLETGTIDAFIPARRLYTSFGFQECEPFADYVEDPNSVFMTKAL